MADQKISALTGATTLDGTELLTLVQSGANKKMGVAAALAALGAQITSPLEIPGCQLWLDASQIAGVNDGDPIVTWPDLSGNHYDAGKMVEVQKIDITGATSGTWTITKSGDTTTELDWNASAADVQSAIQALPSVGAGNAFVSLVDQVYWIRMIYKGSAFSADNVSGDVNPFVDLMTGNAGQTDGPLFRQAVRNGLSVADFGDGDNRMLALRTGLGMLRNCAGVTVCVASEYRTQTYDVFFASASNAADNARFSHNDSVVYVDPTDDGAPGSYGYNSTIGVNTQWTAMSYFSHFADGGVFFDPLPITNFAPVSGGNATIGAQVDPFTPVALSVDTDSMVIQIGRNGKDGYTAGKVGEIIVYNRCLNARERRALHEYLSVKWLAL